MQRVVLMGCPGSGKTTFATKFAKIAKLPVIHLDRECNMPELQGRNKEKNWRKRYSALVAQKRWVMDGGYHQIVSESIERADLIIWFELPTLTCFFRVLKRTFANYGRERADTAPGQVTRLELVLLWSVLKFRRFMSHRMQKLIVDRPKNTKLVVVRNNDDIDSVLALLKI